jgi:membrane fusion protein, heavy metal efflux system
MSKYILSLAASALMFIGCSDYNANKHSHVHAEIDLEALVYTIYSDKTELFVEFKPLVVDSKSNFAAHFTILGEHFLPLTNGKVTVSLTHIAQN